ncbi:MAG: peroxide stress protein YaaA [Rhodospirillales bacterium CG15_BIG_FIL_POST_REV_8_21_14_020_66_15]|nr:MAG: peroxide stress protein YaaA [Rhodospirillales bacterium CG15_BIG_FIL_POST_REV_8_21_14_020_66_15]
MLALISPAKKLDFESEPTIQTHTQPDFLAQSKKLVQAARKLTRQDLRNLMGISEALADQNYRRFKDFKPPFDLTNAKQAAMVFNGDTYVGLKARELSTADLEYAQDHLRILSGLYGVLRPLDLIQPYRLEMSLKFKNPSGETLYEFWNGTLANAVDKAVQGHKDPTVVNLASNEYFKAVDAKALKSRVITPVFKEVNQGQARVLGMFAKQARGMMARYLIVNRIEKTNGLKKFADGGYRFQPEQSDDKTWVFTRKQPPKVTK